jgi:hypothetical protein
VFRDVWLQLVSYGQVRIGLKNEMRACQAAVLLLMYVVWLLLVTLSCNADLWRSQRSPLHEDQLSSDEHSYRGTRRRTSSFYCRLTIWWLWENCFILPLAIYCLCGQTIGLPVKYCFCNSNRVSKRRRELTSSLCMPLGVWCEWRYNSTDS